MIFKNSVLLAVFSILSVLLGIFRDRLLATIVGIGPTLDIYNAAFRIPDFLYALSLAFVTSGTVVPFLTIEDKHGHVIDARHKLSSISLFFAGVISLLAIIIAITLPFYARLIVPGFTDDQLSTFISVSRLMLVQPALIGLTSLISCFAQLKNHFVLYGVAPLGYSLGIISGIVFLYPYYGVYGLIYGVLIGASASFCIQLFSLRKSRILSILPYFSFHDVKALILLGYPRTGVNVLTQLRVIFFTAFATTLGPGVLSSYLFAQRVTDAAIQIIQQSVTTASIPVLSKEYIEGRVSEYKYLVKKYVTVLGLIGVLFAFGVYIVQDLVVFVLYGSTAYHDLIVFFLKGFLLALPFTMMVGYFSISLYSMKDTKSVLLSNFLSTVVAVFVCYSTQSQGNVSLVYGIASMAVSNFLLLFILYSKKKL
jgi:putative peptidoglycan lipid II flippase